VRFAPGVLTRVAVVGLLAAAPALLGAFRTNLLSEILIFGLFAASLDLLIGYTGLPSLGHAGYLGVGAYAAGLLATHDVTTNAFAQLGVATGAAALVAAATGVFAIRARGIYFLMLTLAFGELLYQLAFNWYSRTGGSNGLFGIPPATLHRGDTPLDVNTHPDRFYYYALGAFLIGYGFLRVVIASPFGRALVGIRENESRMRSLGYNVALYKLAAFSIAGGVAGYAGALTLEHGKGVSPSDMSFQVSALAVIALIVGGRATLLGPVLGAAFVYLIRDELASHIQEHWPIVLGAVFILVVYLLPGGFVAAGRWLRRPARSGVAPARAAP
jgi:branched-chain amino acid transport system permease protein